MALGVELLRREGEGEGGVEEEEGGGEEGGEKALREGDGGTEGGRGEGKM